MTNNSDNVFEFEVNIELPDGTSKDVDNLTRHLFIELQDFHTEHIELKKTDSIPKNTKPADPVTIGAITIAVLPTLLPKVVEFIQAWSMRGDKKVVKFKGKISGEMIEFEGTPEELQKIISKIVKAKK